MAPEQASAPGRQCSERQRTGQWVAGWLFHDVAGERVTSWERALYFRVSEISERAPMIDWGALRASLETGEAWPTNQQFRFGIFDFDAATLELRKAQRPVRLRPQSLKVLRLLVSRPRQLISREEIHKELWGADVFVDFEQGVNHSVKQLRAALGDDADVPRYIETLPRRGYRFIAPVESFSEVEEPASPLPQTSHPRSFRRLQSSTAYVVTQVARHKAGTALIACALALVAGGAWWAVSWRRL